jgi:hypothetical protein
MECSGNAEREEGDKQRRKEEKEEKNRRGGEKRREEEKKEEKKRRREERKEKKRKEETIIKIIKDQERFPDSMAAMDENWDLAQRIEGKKPRGLSLREIEQADPMGDVLESQSDRTSLHVWAQWD